VKLLLILSSILILSAIGVQESFAENDSSEITSGLLISNPPKLGETVEMILYYDIQIDSEIPVEILEGFYLPVGFVIIEQDDFITPAIGERFNDGSFVKMKTITDSGYYQSKVTIKAIHEGYWSIGGGVTVLGGNTQGNPIIYLKVGEKESLVQETPFDKSVVMNWPSKPYFTKESESSVSESLNVKNSRTIDYLQFGDTRQLDYTITDDNQIDKIRLGNDRITFFLNTTSDGTLSFSANKITGFNFDRLCYPHKLTVVMDNQEIPVSNYSYTETQDFTINFTENNSQFDSDGVQFVINPFDEFALTRAMWFKEKQGATVTVVNVGTKYVPFSFIRDKVLFDK